MKRHKWLAAGLALAMLSPGALYLGTSLAVHFDNFVYLPIPAMVDIVMACVCFDRAEKLL